MDLFLYLFGEGRQLDVEPSVALLHIVTMLLFALFLIAEGAAILTYAIQQKKSGIVSMKGMVSLH